MIEVQNVFAGYYKDIDVLQGLSIRAELGKITIIIGGNGVGKSTLLKTIYGFLRPNKGGIYYKEGEITGTEPYFMAAKGISYITQRHSVFPYLTVEENIALGGWSLRKDKQLIKQRVSENFDRFQRLSEKRNADAGSLSGGEQRLVEIARGLMTDPEMLLFDEPSAGLEPRRTREIYRRLEKLKYEEKRGILLVDQNVRQAMEIADYIYVIEMGQNNLEGTREDFNTDLKEMIKDWL